MRTAAYARVHGLSRHRGRRDILREGESLPCQAIESTNGCVVYLIDHTRAKSKKVSSSCAPMVLKPSLINPRRACAGGLRYLVCVCVSVCLSVCLSVRHRESCHYVQRSVQPKVPTASAQSGKRFKYGVFSKNALFKSYGVKKPTR